MEETFPDDGQFLVPSGGRAAEPVTALSLNAVGHDATAAPLQESILTGTFSVTPTAVIV